MVVVEHEPSRGASEVLELSSSPPELDGGANGGLKALGVIGHFCVYTLRLAIALCVFFQCLVIEDESFQFCGTDERTVLGHP